MVPFCSLAVVSLTLHIVSIEDYTLLRVNLLTLHVQLLLSTLPLDIGIHRVENRSTEMACTLHVYAPPLRKMKVYDQESGLVHVIVAKSKQGAGCEGGRLDEGIFDVEAWNRRLVTSKC